MELIVISISSVFIAIFLICSLYWAIVFARRIRVYKVYQKSAYRNILDFKFGYINEQWCYHYETEIWKYIYLLAINSTEALGSIFYYFRRIFLTYLETAPKLYLHHFQMIETCGSVNNTYLIRSETINSSIVFLNIIESIGNISDIALVSLLICLMNYLTMRIKRIETSPRTFSNTSILFMTCIVSVLIVLLCSIHPLLLVGRMIYILAFMVVFWNFIITVKQFRFTLQLRSIQRLAQHGSNKEEMREKEYFKFATNILCIGFLFIFLSLCLGNILRICISSVFFSECLFLSNPFLNNRFNIACNGQLSILTEILQCLSMLGDALCLLGLFIILVPFILGTSHSWYKFVNQALGRNSTDYRIEVHQFYEKFDN